MSFPKRITLLRGMPTSSSAIRPPGPDDPSELLEERREVGEVAQREPARHAVDRRVGHGQAQDVTLNPRCARAIGGEHPEREVDRDRPMSRLAEVDTQIAGARGEVEHGRSGRQAQVAHGAPPPTHVEPERHDPVDEVVARGDRIEHLANRLLLLVTLRQRVAVPRMARCRHAVRLARRRIGTIERPSCRQRPGRRTTLAP